MVLESTTWKEVNEVTKLEELRRKAGMTQAQLSQKSGVSVPVIVKIENGGIGGVLGRNMIALADALEVQVGELF